MEATYYKETSLSTYKSVRRQIPEYSLNDLVVTGSDATCRYGHLQGKHHCVHSFVSLRFLTAARSIVTVARQRKAKNRMCGGSCCIWYSWQWCGERHCIHLRSCRRVLKGSAVANRSEQRHVGGLKCNWKFRMLHIEACSQDGSVGVMSCPQFARQSSHVVWFPVYANEFSTLQCVHTGCGAYPPFYSMGIGGFFSGGKAAGEWNCPLTSI